MNQSNALFDLDRFIQAQAHDYERALQEIRSGQKRTHWMWYIFPQLAGLGSSPMAQRYAIQDITETEAYLKHPVLGPRLIQSAEAVLGIQGRTARQIFGSPDDLKLRSCATLFSHAAAQSQMPEDSVFNRLIDACFGGGRDPRTLELLNSKPSLQNLRIPRLDAAENQHGV